MTFRKTHWKSSVSDSLFKEIAVLRPRTLLKRDSRIRVFLCIFRCFSEKVLRRKSSRRKSPSYKHLSKLRRLFRARLNVGDCLFKLGNDPMKAVIGRCFRRMDIHNKQLKKIDLGLFLLKLKSCVLPICEE